MKIRLLIIIALSVCVIATPATADFMLSPSEASSLTMQGFSTGGGYYTPQLNPNSPFTSLAGYGDLLQGDYGYVGVLDPDNSADHFAWMEIGLGSSPGDLSSFTSYDLFIANDNDDYWGVMLYVETYDSGNSGSTTTYYSSGNTSISGYSDFTELGEGTNTILSLDLTSVANLSNVVDIGFVVGAKHTSSGYPSFGDSFHISIVPVPAAVILGILGLGVAGIKLRKYA